MTVHVAIRAPARERVNGRNLSVIEEHNRTFNGQGRVAFGKVGARLSDATLGTLQGEIAKGQPVRLYVVVKGKDGYASYSAELAEVGHVRSKAHP
jgi:hypothetical protein